ncbi:Hypothetical protein POVR2_LOCUS43, partial [uncultured virus]
VGTAAVTVLNNAELSVNEWISVDMKPEQIKVTWQGVAPTVRSSDFLDAEFAQGYQVSYQVDYYLGGYIYVDSGSAQFVEHTTDVAGNLQPANTLTPSKGAGFWYYWTYGTADGAPRYTVPVGVVPRTIRYSVQRSGVKYTPHEMTWNIAYTITVVQDCTSGNVPAQICQDLCLGSLSPECYANYNQYCLQGDPARIAEQPCRDFFTKWIAVKGSDEQIDRQARAYCGKKYRGFADLRETNPRIPDAERLADIPICACNLVAPPPAADPVGTVLYANYFNSLAAQYPGFGVYGASIQQKCLIPECASAAFKPAGVSPGGCSVPQCIDLVTVNNNGTINGNVTITQSVSCEETANGSNLTIATVVIIVLAVLLVVYAIIYFFTTPGSHRFSNKSAQRSNGTASASNTATVITR